jgi:hypothetical protein
MTAMRDVEVGDEGPETQFARLGEDRIAYQVFGDWTLTCPRARS